jgi:hypothetical protein
MPLSPWAYLLDLLIIVFLATVFMAANRNTHSVSDMFYNIFPFFAAAFLLREWLAQKLK